jgi:cytoskeletal protein RodZ
MECMPKRGVLLILGAVVLAAASGSAQSVKGRPKAPPAKTAPSKTQSAPPSPAKDKDKDTAAAGSDTEPASSAAPAMTGRAEAKTAPPPKTYTGDGGVTVVEKGATKQFQFTETDVEGRLKVPQLVYFLRRVRAEFAAGDLGHRSFMRELSATQRDPDF